PRPQSPRNQDALLACRSRQSGKSIESLWAGLGFSSSCRPEILRRRVYASPPSVRTVSSARAHNLRNHALAPVSISRPTSPAPNLQGDQNHPQAITPLIFNHLSSATQPKWHVCEKRGETTSLMPKSSVLVVERSKNS